MIFKKIIIDKKDMKNDVIKKDVIVSGLDEKEIKNAIEGASINVLLGSGFTANLYKPLNNIEELLTDVEVLGNENLKDIIMWRFFNETLLPMKNTLINDMQIQIEFFKTLREILSRRGNPVKNKQANIFTTNYDLVPEYVMEYLNIDYNDGFKGKIAPKFSTANYGNILIKNLMSSNNKAEIECVNLYKLHGSLTWKNGKKSNTEFFFDYYNVIEEIFEEYRYKFKEDEFRKVEKLINKNNKSELLSIITEGKGFFDKIINEFNMVWPTKKKFHNSVLNMNYYELLRIFSNELEKNQSLLIVFGFSFNDEHILEIVKRSLSNPTLLVYVFCYKFEDAKNIYKKFENCENFNNIKFIYEENQNFDLVKLNILLKKIYL